MTPLAWHRVEKVDPSKFGAARRQAHSAVQWLARIARSYGPEDPDQNNPALLWHRGHKAIVTQELTGKLGMELQLPQLVMHFTEGGEPVRHDFETEGHSPAHVEAWILVELLHRGIDRDRFSKALPYDVSDLMTGDAVEFSPETCEAELGALSAWYENAAAVLGEAAREESEDGGSATKLRLWPQDLSLELLLPLKGVETVEARAVRVGFSPGGARASEPYFYVARKEAGEGRTREPEAVLKVSELQDGTAAEEALRFLREWIRAARLKAAQ